MAVLALAFLAVGREGVETALFMVGYAEAQTAWPLIGPVIGVLIAAAIAYGMYAGAIRINLAKFFKYTGVFLIVVAAGILSYGVGALQTVGWLPGLSRKAFDITSWFNWSSWYGEVHPGHLQRHARRRRCCSSACGWRTSSSCWRSSCAQRRRPRKPIPHHNLYPNPKGQPREAAVDPCHRHRSAGGSGTDELPK